MHKKIQKLGDYRNGAAARLKWRDGSLIGFLFQLVYTHHKADGKVPAHAPIRSAFR